MKLPQDFIDYIASKLIHHSKAMSNPSAFTSIFYIRGYETTLRRGEIHKLIEKEIQRIKS